MAANKYLRPGMITFFIGSLLMATQLSAQQQVFAGLAFEHEVTPRYGYQLEIEHRQIIKTGLENRILLQAASNFVIFEGCSITPALRFTPKYGEKPGTVRLQTDLNYAVELGKGPVSIETRIRAQRESEVGSQATGQAKVAVRPRLGLAYSLFDHTDVVLEYEARYRFDRRNEFARHRMTLGLSQEVSTRISVEAFYRLERNANVPSVVTDPTLGLYLNYVLPDARKRDWKYRRPFGRSLLF